MTWCPLSSVPCESVTQTLPSASTWMPWGSTKSPRSEAGHDLAGLAVELEDRVDEVLGTSARQPHAAATGRTPRCARRSGRCRRPRSSPIRARRGGPTQSAMTVGFGFGRSSAGSSMGLGSMGVASTSADSSAPSGAQPAAHSRPANNAGVEIRETMRLLMTAPRGFGPWPPPGRERPDWHVAPRGRP